MFLHWPRYKRAPERTLADLARRNPEMFHRGLLAEHVALWCLTREIARSHRNGLPLTIAVLVPLVENHSPFQKAIDASVRALVKTVRASDIVAWHDSQSILAILPETTGDQAHRAVARWRSEMWKRSLRAGGVLWTFYILENASRFASASSVLWELERLRATA